MQKLKTIISKTNIGPVLPRMFSGWPAKRAKRIPTIAAVRIHSIVP